MLNTHVIDRTLQAHDNDKLLRDLERNGLVMPLPLRARLGCDLGATALGLRRLIELSYGPNPVIMRLTRQLVAAVEHEPLIDADGHACPVLAATVAAALGRMLEDYAGLLGEEDAPIRNAYHQAMAQLAQMQTADGLIHHPSDTDPASQRLSTAFVAYLLIQDDLFGQLAQRHALLSALDEAYDHCDSPTCELIDLARPGHRAPYIPTSASAPFQNFTLQAA